MDGDGVYKGSEENDFCRIDYKWNILVNGEKNRMMRLALLNI